MANFDPNSRVACFLIDDDDNDDDCKLFVGQRSSTRALEHYQKRDVWILEGLFMNGAALAECPLNR